jgi:triosephosphate isomerase (TIM)
VSLSRSFCLIPDIPLNQIYALSYFLQPLISQRFTVYWKIRQCSGGAQNCYFENKGAFTGETSPEVAKELGCTYVLVGHSERRQIFGETDELLAKKVAVVQRLGMTPMLCIGELLEQRESGQTYSIVRNQLQKGLASVDFEKPLTVAYEPVWAIGTGKVATPAQVKETQGQIRSILYELGGKAHEETPILYGGSVKPDNAEELARLKDVDGFLVGGASLDPDTFGKIMNVSEIMF